MGFGFDTFGNHLGGVRVGCADDEVHLLSALVGLLCGENKFPIEFYKIGMEFGDVINTGVTGAHVIDGGEGTALAVVFEDVPKVIHIGDFLGFDNFKHDARHGDVILCGSFHGGAQADGGIINGVGEKVDEDAGSVGDVLGCTADGDLARALIHLVMQVELFAGVDDRAGAENLLGVGIAGAEQGFLGEEVTGFGVDDGVKDAEKPVVAEGFPDPFMFESVEEFRERASDEERAHDLVHGDNS